jgi:hypothetical protein
MGEYSDGGGPASSFNVYFYGDGGNRPGALVAAFLNLAYTGTPPDFTITLPSPFGIGPGTFWVSVQARQDFTVHVSVGVGVAVGVGVTDAVGEGVIDGVGVGVAVGVGVGVGEGVGPSAKPRIWKTWSGHT